MLFSDCSAIALNACTVQLLWMHNIDLLKIALSFSSSQVLQRNNMEKVAALVPKIIQVISSSSGHLIRFSIHTKYCRKHFYLVDTVFSKWIWYDSWKFDDKIVIQYMGWK